MLRNTLVMAAAALLLNLTGFTAVASAKTVQVEATFNMSGDNVRDIETSELSKSGWTVSENSGETTYKLSVEIDSSKLPYRSEIGEAFLTIGKTGLITMGISVGDDDAGAEASLQWPVEKKKLVTLGQPLVLSVNGGENASGAWSFDGQATVTVVD